MSDRVKEIITRPPDVTFTDEPGADDCTGRSLCLFIKTKSHGGKRLTELCIELVLREVDGWSFWFKPRD